MASKLLDKTVSDKVLELDLGKMGIEDLGQLSRRGYGISADVIPQAELYIDSDRMQLARWPNSDWVGTTDIVRSGARSKKEFWKVRFIKLIMTVLLSGKQISMKYILQAS